MNIGQIIATIEEVIGLYNSLKADGSLAKLLEAEAAVQHEIATNKDLQKLLALIGIHLPTPTPPAPLTAELAAEEATL